MQALSDNHHKLLIGHAVETLRRLYPAAQIRMTDSARPDRGWLLPTGQSVINMRHAQADTPFHEMGHVWEAVLNDQLPAAEYDGYLAELTGSPQLAAVQARYPEKNDRHQRREALVQMLGEHAAGGIVVRGGAPEQQSALRALARRLYQQLRTLLTPLLGPPDLLELPLSMRSLRSVLQQGVEALIETPSSLLTSKYAKRLLTETLEQRVSAARNPGEFMELLTGQDPVFSDNEMQGKANELLAYAQSNLVANNNQLKFQIPGKIGLHSFPAGITTDEDRKNYIADKLREGQVETKQQIGEDALAYFNASPDEQARLEKGLYATEAEQADQTDFDDKKRDRRQAYYRVIAEMLPDYEPGDKVTHYVDAGTDFYHAAVDSGSILLHQAMRKDPVTRVEKKVVSLLALTSGPLGETRKDRSFLAGLYDGSGLRGFFRNLAVRHGLEVKLPATHENRLKMQLLLAAMHLKKQGYQVNGMNIGKLDVGRTNENQTVTFWPTEHLQAYAVIRDTLPVREALKASGEQGEYLLSLLDDKTLFSAADYSNDPLRHLSDHYKASIPPARAIRAALGEYYSKKSAASLLSLEKAMLRRINELIRSSVGDKHKTDPEFIMLSNAHVQLKGGNFYLNPWRVIDRVTQLYTSFLRNDNPIVTYFINEWDNRWYLVAQEFQKLQAQHRAITASLHDWHKSTHGGVGAELLFEKTQGKYYDALWVKETLSYFNVKTNAVEQREVNLHRLHQPGSTAYAALAAPQKQYIDWVLATIKERVIAVERQRRISDGRTFTEKELNDYHEKNWGDGRVPVVQASVWQSVLKGDVAYASEQQLRSLFDDNPRFHDQQSDQEDHLSEYILTQGDNDQRRKLLGLEKTPDGKGQVLRGQDGLEVHNRLETDLRRVMNIVMMQTLKHEKTADLDTPLRIGQALIRFHDVALGYVRHGGQLNGTASDDAAGGSQNEKAFIEMARMLWLNRTNQGKGAGLEKRLAQLLSVAGSLTTSTILLGNIIIPIQTALTTTFGNLLPQALAANGFEESTNTPSSEYLKKAIGIVSTPAKWPMLEAMARQLGVSRHGEFDLLSQRKNTGEPLRLFSTETAYALDRWADDATRITIMVAMLEQQGIMDNYSFNEETGELSYDVARDRKIRSDATVDLVRENLESEGVLAPGQPLDRAFDGTLRRTMEAVIGDVMAGYSPLTQSGVGATFIGSMTRKLAGYMPMRIERALMERRNTPGKAKYVEGKKVHEEEVGQLRTLLKRLSQGTIESMGLVSKASRGERMTTADQLNMRNLTANFALYAAFSTAAYGIGASMPDDKKNQKRNIGLKLLDSLIMETFAFENFRMILGKAANPFIVMTMLKNMADTFSAALMPGKNSGQGWHQLTSRVGGKKTVDNITSLFGEE